MAGLGRRCSLRASGDRSLKVMPTLKNPYISRGNAARTRTSTGSSGNTPGRRRDNRRHCNYLWAVADSLNDGAGGDGLAGGDLAVITPRAFSLMAQVMRVAVWTCVACRCSMPGKAAAERHLGESEAVLDFVDHERSLRLRGARRPLTRESCCHTASRKTAVALTCAGSSPRSWWRRSAASARSSR